MTLQEAKDQVARDLAYHDWNEYMTLFYPTGMIEIIDRDLNKVAELYARSKWDQACEEQKHEIKLKMDRYSDYSLIDNAPKPEFKP